MRKAGAFHRISGRFRHRLPNRCLQTQNKRRAQIALYTIAAKWM
jgi:hypothetical protein